MSRTASRVQLTRGYVLHQRPFRDTSLIVEVFTREYGRLTVFARAARGPRSRLAALQPFRALLLSWVGRGEAPQLTAAEAAAAEAPELAASLATIPAAHLISAFYVNELLLKLVMRHDPHPELFDQYVHTLERLAQATTVDAPLRQFEARLLDFIGYGLNLTAEADSGEPVRAESYYHFQPGVHGLVSTEQGISGQVLLDLAAGAELTDEAALRAARTLMRAAIDHCLEGRELATRSVARALQGYGA